MDGFTELAIIIGIAAFFGIFARKLRQPVILGYVVAGVMLSLFFPMFKQDTEHLELYSKIGVAFLLFIVGLELNLKEIKKLGLGTLFSGVGQIVVTCVSGMGLGLLLGFNLVESVLIGICLTFSSTIVVIKLLSQKKELDTLHGKLTTVFLVVQDLSAIILMIVLVTVVKFDSSNITTQIFSLTWKAALIIAIIVICTRIILPFFLKFINRERETLFISIVAWALLFSAFVGSEFIGFSVEIGALLAGVSLADRYEHLQIESWIRPLRDFFLTVFFVLLGLHASISSLDNVLVPVIAMVLFVIIAKPLIIILLLGKQHFNKRVSFATGVSLAQVSEFSLLIITLDILSRQLSESLPTIITLVGGLTMIISSVMITYNHKIYELFGKLSLSKKRKGSEESEFDLENKILLLGCHRIGKNVLDYLIKEGESIVVIDHNPSRIESLRKMGIDAIMGDMRDYDFVDSLTLESVRYIISTIPHMETNSILMDKVSHTTPRPVTILLAKEEEEVTVLYDMGADYVVYPYILTGQRVNTILKNRTNSDKHKLNTMKNILNSRHFE